jgi:hypothetical protein
MPHLYKVTYEYIGEIDDDQLDLLVDALEEEDEEDQDYFVDPETLDYLAEQGLDPGVVAMLRRAVGEEGAEIVWDEEPPE